MKYMSREGLYVMIFFTMIAAMRGCYNAGEVRDMHERQLKSGYLETKSPNTEYSGISREFEIKFNGRPIQEYFNS